MPSGAKRTGPAPPGGVIPAEESLAEFLENAPVGLNALDPEGRILWANRAELELFGYAPEEYIGHNVAEFHADPAAVSEILSRLARNEPVLGYEARMRCKDGSFRHVLISSNVLRRDGRLLHSRCFTRDISDRKRTEDALRASERQFRAVFETARDAIVIADDEGRYLEVNQATCDMFGRERHELLGRRAGDFAPPGFDFRGAWRKFLSATTEAGEFVIVRPDGTQRELEYNATAHFLPGRHVSVLRDVTERRRGERLLGIRHAVATLLSGAPPVSEAVPRMLQAICEGLGWDMGGVWVVDSQRHDLYCLGMWEAEWLRGRAFGRVTGEGRFGRGQGLPGRVYASRAHAWIPDVQADDNFPRAAAARESGLHGGSGFPLLLGGECLGVVEFFSRDIGKLDEPLSILMGDLASHFASYLVRTRVQQELRESEERYRLLVDHAPDGIAVATEGRFVFVNPAGLRLLGAREAGEVIGRPVLELVAPEDRERIAGRLGGTATEDPPLAECRLLRVDGTAVDAEVGAFQFQHAGRDAVQLVLRDTTARRRAEEERQRLLEDAEEARRRAETANRLKDEFLATLSHELRTPLSAIVGWTHLLRSSRLDEATVHHALATIERNARAQTQLIEDLLDVSRIVTGKLRLDVRPVELAGVLEAALDSVRPAAEARALSLERELPPESAVVAGDPDRLQQVVWNLLSNAIKFTAKGGRVALRLVRSDGHAEIRVEDTGIGIAREFLPHVFARFSQADPTSTRQHQGLGLGLAIVRHLVELHGGTVRAESDGEGRGASFVVRLPLLDTAPAGRRAAVRALASPSSVFASPDLEGVRVLVVDDDPDALDLVSTLLRQKGAVVLSATRADEALQILRQERPQVLVSDIEMPGEDGYAFIRRVRALGAEEGGRTPAAALTAYARTQDRLRALLAGYQIHLPKPVDPAELASVVASLVERTPRP